MSAGRPVTRLVALAVAASAVLFLGWAWLAYLRAPAVGTFHDDGIYLVTAKALATGHGYRIISLPGDPLQTKYPILFPWLLSLVYRADPSFPENLLALRLVPFGAALTWLALAFRLLRRLGAPAAAAGLAILLTAISPWTLYLSTTLLSESLFAAAVTGALLILESEPRDTVGPARAAAAGLLMGAAILTRTAAVAPAAAVLAVLAVRRRWVAVFTYAGVVAALSAPWFWWVVQHRGEPIADAFYSGANYASWNIVFGYPWRTKLAIVLVNAFWATQFGQFWGLPIGTWAAWVTAALCSALLVRGLWVSRASVAAVSCVAYLLLLLGWAFPPTRFMVPVMPLLVWFMWSGAGRAKIAAGVVAAVLVVTSGAAMQRQVTATLERGGTWFGASQVDDWHAMRRQYDWLSTNTAPDAVVVATHDPTVFLFTGRRAIRPSTMDPVRLYYNVRGVAPDIEADAEALRLRVLGVGADYVLMTPRDDERALARLLARCPDAFTLVEGGSSSRYRIYKVDRPRLNVPAG